MGGVGGWGVLHTSIFVFLTACTAVYLFEISIVFCVYNVTFYFGCALLIMTFPFNINTSSLRNWLMVALPKTLSDIHIFLFVSPSGRDEGDARGI